MRGYIFIGLTLIVLSYVGVAKLEASFHTELGTKVAPKKSSTNKQPPLAKGTKCTVKTNNDPTLQAEVKSNKSLSNQFSSGIGGAKVGKCSVEKIGGKWKVKGNGKTCDVTQGGDKCPSIASYKDPKSKKDTLRCGKKVNPTCSPQGAGKGGGAGSPKKVEKKSDSKGNGGAPKKPEAKQGGGKRGSLPLPKLPEPKPKPKPEPKQDKGYKKKLQSEIWKNLKTASSTDLAALRQPSLGDVESAKDPRNQSSQAPSPAKPSLFSRARALFTGNSSQVGGFTTQQRADIDNPYNDLGSAREPSNSYPAVGRALGGIGARQYSGYDTVSQGQQYPAQSDSNFSGTAPSAGFSSSVSSVVRGALSSIPTVGLLGSIADFFGF